MSVIGEADVKSQGAQGCHLRSWEEWEVEVEGEREQELRDSGKWANNSRDRPWINAALNFGGRRFLLQWAAGSTVS